MTKQKIFFWSIILLSVVFFAKVLLDQAFPRHAYLSVMLILLLTIAIAFNSEDMLKVNYLGKFMTVSSLVTYLLLIVVNYLVGFWTGHIILIFITLIAMNHVFNSNLYTKKFKNILLSSFVAEVVIAFFMII